MLKFAIELGFALSNPRILFFCLILACTLSLWGDQDSVTFEWDPVTHLADGKTKTVEQIKYRLYQNNERLAETTKTQISFDRDELNQAANFHVTSVNSVGESKPSESIALPEPEDVVDETPLQIYPNPATLSTNILAESEEIKIYNILGRLVEVVEPGRISLDGFATGMYIVRIKVNKKNISRKLWVIK